MIKIKQIFFYVSTVPNINLLSCKVALWSLLLKHIEDSFQKWPQKWTIILYLLLSYQNEKSIRFTFNSNLFHVIFTYKFINTSRFKYTLSCIYNICFSEWNVF